MSALSSRSSFEKKPLVEPSYSTVPLCITMTLLVYSETRVISWVITKIVVPAWFNSSSRHHDVLGHPEVLTGGGFVNYHYLRVHGKNRCYG